MLSKTTLANQLLLCSLYVMNTPFTQCLGAEKQITYALHGHILTNVHVWSPDSQWIAYDVRSDPAGSEFDGSRIERVHVKTAKVDVLYQATNGAHCGVVTWNPTDDRLVFILGPENPCADWSYSACHRRGLIVHASHPGHAETLDARDLQPPFTPGALRGGTHVHVFSGDGQWVSHTYEDHLLTMLDDQNTEKPRTNHELNQRNVGVSVPKKAVQVPNDHPRNNGSNWFTVLATHTTNHPTPGSDEISRAFSDAWVGSNGYLRTDGTRQQRAIAFQGHVVTQHGDTISEVFVVDLPDDVTIPGTRPLEGTSRRRPAPPRGIRQRRLTFTADRQHPGIQGPRHWLRSSPNGSRIAFLMKDDTGVVQLWTISPNGGRPKQLTRNGKDIGSAFTWSDDGNWIAHVMDRSICVTDTQDGITHRLTQRSTPPESPRPEACVFSPDGHWIAYVRPVQYDRIYWNQIFIVSTRSLTRANAQEPTLP